MVVLRAIAAVFWVVLLCGPTVAADGAGWTPLLDGESIADWTVEGESPAAFEFSDGVVTGQPIGNNPKNAFLCSPRDYDDFELEFSFRIAPTSLNSGVQFRSRVREDGIVAGPQLELEVEDPSDIPFMRRWFYPFMVRFTSVPWRPRYWASAGVYGEALETGWIYPGVAGGDADAFAEQGERLTRPDGWNDMRLEAVGKRVRTWLNGEPRADYEHGPTTAAGKFCLQVHGGEYEDPSQYKIEWRSLRIRERESPNGD